MAPAQSCGRHFYFSIPSFPAFCYLTMKILVSIFFIIRNYGDA